jgi:hypothetical protein
VSAPNPPELRPLERSNRPHENLKVGYFGGPQAITMIGLALFVFGFILGWVAHP